MNWDDLPPGRRNYLAAFLTPAQLADWKEPQADKIERLRNLFGGMPGVGPSIDFHHYGVHIGPMPALALRHAQIAALGPAIVRCSPLGGGAFLALWKVPDGELLLNP